jgi:hypothetical protein
MSGRDLIEAQLKEEVALAPWNAVATGELLAITDEGSTPIVRFAGQANAAAVRARSVVDLHGAHIGSAVVLMFEEADPQRPIVMGVLRGTQAWPLPEAPAQVRSMPTASACW